MFPIRALWTNRQRGAVLVEMVLVTPILLIVMLGVAEVTRLFVDHNTLTKAVRNGARHIASNALNGSQGVVVLDANLIAEAQSLVVYGNTGGAGAPVLPNLTMADVTVTDVGNGNIEVTVTHPMTGMLGPALRSLTGGSDINLVHNLQATVTMRAL